MLDNKKIETNSNSSKDQPPKAISPPPKFLFPQASLAAPTPSRLGRGRRSASPSKIASPRKAAATPRKSKGSKASSTDSHTNAANKNLHQALKKAATVGDSDVSTPEASEPRTSVGPEDTPKEPKKEDMSEETASEPKVTVTVEEKVTIKDEVETTHTHVEVEMPAGLPELPLPEDPAEMIARAKEMVEAANEKEKAALEGENAQITLPKRSKRKAEDVEEEGADSTEAGSSKGAPVVKKAKVETELKKEKVKARALIGISATLAIGYVLPGLDVETSFMLIILQCDDSLHIQSLLNLGNASVHSLQHSSLFGRHDEGL